MLPERSLDRKAGCLGAIVGVAVSGPARSCVSIWSPRVEGPCGMRGVLSNSKSSLSESFSDSESAASEVASPSAIEGVCLKLVPVSLPRLERAARGR